MKQTLFVAVITILTIVLFNITGDDSPLIPSEAIRLRVLANSNSEYDQQVKNEVTEELQSILYEKLKDTESISEAKDIITSNMNTFDSKVKKTLAKANYQLPYRIDYGYHHFPEKIYKGVTYEEGEYESLLVTLGSGEGNNWWCVLFPPLCLLEAEETTKDDVQYKFFITEILKLFSK